jgi:hypothetical protein
VIRGIVVLDHRPSIRARGLLFSSFLLLDFARLGFAPAATAVTRSELAGNSRAGSPWFQPAQAFHESGSIEVGVDPSRFPQLVGQTIDVYVVAARSAAEWSNDPLLVDVRGAPDARTITGTTIQENTFPLAGPFALDGDAGPGLGVGYDVALDVDRDGSLDEGDMLDGGGAEAGFYCLRDTAEPGPLEVTTFTNNAGFFLTQIFFVPAAIASLGEIPIVFIGHGWTHDYTWYDHIGNHLASYGYVVVSFRNDVGAGDPQGTQTASTSTLNNVDYVLGHLDTLGGGILDGHIDTHKIIWMGHSTGGEAVVRAYTRVLDGLFIPQHFVPADIVLISSIAPVNWLPPESCSPRFVNYQLFLGASDVDTSNEPIPSYVQSIVNYERGRGDKQLIYVHGAGHEDFHNGPGPSPVEGPDPIGRAATHQVVKGYLLPLVELYAKGNPAGREFFTRMYEDFHPAGIDANVVIANEFKEGETAEKFVLDDFQSAPAWNVSSSGGAVTSDVLNLQEVLMRDFDGALAWTGLQPSNGMTRSRFAGDSARCAVFDWGLSAPRFYELEVVPSRRDFSEREFLSFRACQGTRHPQTVALDGPMSFTVTLRDGVGTSSSIDFGVVGRITRPYQRTGLGSGAGWANEFMTVRIRLTDFQTNGSGIDLSDIAAVRFDFGAAFGSARGRIGLDDIAVTGVLPAVVAAPIPSPLHIPLQIAAAPNPFRTTTAVSYHLPSATVIRLSMYDAAGRLVRELMRGPRPAGRSEEHWDGCDAAGSTVAPGVYFVRLEAAGQPASARVVRLR